MGSLECLALPPDSGLPNRESVAVGAHPEKREGPRTVATDRGRQALASDDEFGGIQLFGRGGAAVDEVGDAVPRFQQLALLGGVQLPLGEAGLVQRGPEAVSGPREVVP